MTAPLYAPIALFVYNRADHARRTLASLLANQEASGSELYIFSDAPRNPGAAAGVAEVRAAMREVEGFASVQLVEREKNLGLAASIVDGVGRLCRERGRVIVLEDDLELSPYFLRYMNDALSLYAAEPKVASIHGYVYPVQGDLPDTFFMRGADCWGWATWGRAWQAYEPDAQLLLRQLRERNLVEDFDFGGKAGYVRMLEDFIAGRNDSWAVRWHAAAYLKEMFTLYPGQSLVRNLGHDGSGTHSGTANPFDSGLARNPVPVLPVEITESPAGRAAFLGYFRKLHPPLVIRALRRAGRLLTGGGASR
jgi:hypothetical protein